jgi:hypothetical protein
MDVSRVGTARLLNEKHSGRRKPDRIALENGSVVMLRPLPGSTTSPPLRRRIERKIDEAE